MLHRRAVLRMAATVTAVSGPLAAGCSSSGSDGPQASESSASSGTSGTSGTSDPSATTSATRSATSSAAPARGSAEVVGTVARDLDSPWGLVELPGGDLLVGFRDDGTVHRVAADTGEVTTAGSVRGVAHGGEGGLLGLALAPDFTSSRDLYAYYTTATDNRISRFTYDAGLSGGETVLSGIPRGDAYHNGGGLAFGPDGMLYASTGDTYDDRELAQDEDSLAGKILRIDPATGQPPGDNPGPDSYVYSLGHRNVQGLAWDASGRLWASEFGDQTWDELNRIVPGGNYGWPAYEGRGGEDAGYTDPVHQWHTDEASPSGLAFQRGSLWMATLQGERLWRIPLDGKRLAAKPRAFFTGEYGRLRAVLATGEDELLLVTNETDSRGTPQAGDDRILRLRVT